MRHSRRALLVGRGLRHIGAGSHLQHYLLIVAQIDGR